MLSRLAPLVLATACTAFAAQVTWIASVESAPSRTMPSPALVSGAGLPPPELRVSPRHTRQVIDGFGGCFNEAGWVALGHATAADRAAVLAGLFADSAAAFNLARLPVGASDFALDYYSLADTPDDYDLKSFSLARDEKHLLPFVRAAQAVRPALRFWASPWTPPAWMKDNGHYSKGSLRQDPAIYDTYADYLARWVESYRALGVAIYALAPQNEPNITNVYPTCLWTAAQLRDFIGGHLGPTFQKRLPDVELWLGLNGDPSNDGENPNARLLTVLEDPRASAYLTGVGFQYDSRNQIALARDLYPEKKLMQTETECFRGENSWSDAQKLFAHLKRYIEGGASAYFAWNFVLDDSGLSTWNWRQNALVTVHRETGAVTFNGEYHVLRHFSAHVKPGARRVLTSGVWGDQIAFLNPDGSVVAIVGNSSDREHALTLAVGDRPGPDTLRVTLPPRSFHTFVFPPAAR